MHDAVFLQRSKPIAAPTPAMTLKCTGPPGKPEEVEKHKPDSKRKPKPPKDPKAKPVPKAKSATEEATQVFQLEHAIRITFSWFKMVALENLSIEWILAPTKLRQWRQRPLSFLSASHGVPSWLLLDCHTLRFMLMKIWVSSANLEHTDSLHREVNTSKTTIHTTVVHIQLCDPLSR